MAIIPEYLRLEQELREKIVAGKMKPGDRLPDEHTLASQYNTSRPTLRKALNILASEGFLNRIPGKGTFINSMDEQRRYLPRQYQYFKKMNKGIGVIVPSIHLYLGVGIVCGVEEAGRKRGYHVLLGNSKGVPKKEAESMELFLRRGVSGLISFAGFTSDASVYTELINQGYPPLVFAGAEIEGVLTDVVKTDNIAGAGEAVYGLFNEGYRNIGFASIGFQSLSSRERFIGYREALSKCGLPFSEQKVFNNKSIVPEQADIEQAKEMLLGTHIDALFAANEYSSLPFIGAIKELKEERFGRFKIIGIDKPDFFDFSGCNISFLNQPAFKIGAVAADLLIDRIERTPHYENIPKKILLSVEKESARKDKELSLHYALAGR